jgi:Protein of unknown function (DUF3768)
MLMTSAQERTRALNDELRIHHRGGRIIITPGVRALGAVLLPRVDEAIATFNEFDEDSDPYGEHDFGVVEVAGHEIMFKIDYYDLTLNYLSFDPANPELTARVMTIMLAEEY